MQPTPSLAPFPSSPSPSSTHPQGYDYYFGQLDQSYCHNMYPSTPLGVWESTGQGAGAAVSHILYPENVGASRARCMGPGGGGCTWTHDLWTNKTIQLLEEQAAAGPAAPPLWL